MFYNKKDMSYLNHWVEWAIKGEEREELFQDVRQLVEDMIKELLPQMIQEYLSGFRIDVETRLNGKAANLEGIKEEIQRLLLEELRKP